MHWLCEAARQSVVRAAAAGQAIALAALFGISAAYAFAAAAFGYVNTCGVFLGAIILGNGINYPIVLLSRFARTSE